jgi:Ca-activated chloride channel family protein
VTVKIRSKEPEKDTSVLSEFAVKDTVGKFANASTDYKFAAAVAAFGMTLRDSQYKGNADLEKALEWAKEGKGMDRNGYRQEFIRLVHRAYSLTE